MVHEGIDFKVEYRTDIANYEHGVIVKQIKRAEETSALLYQLKNEWQHTANLKTEGVRKALAFKEIEGKNVLILESIDGITLREAFNQRRFSLVEFLKIGISISKILSDLHAEKIIHKDLNTKNILISHDFEKVTIIDFGISTKINLKSDYLVNPDKLEGSLAYISPEQTCRMNRVVDYRSDLYSLGVIFYELLAGKLPFEAYDPVEYIYCHIAKTPQPLTEIKPNTEPMVSKIVMKLLAKNAEDRYQSAKGLRNDLERVLNQLAKNQKVEEFELAQNDFSGKFQIYDKLYGRQTELNQLMNRFEQASNGELMVNFVTGFSGVGKSSLVHEIHKPITERRGYFVEGKFDQFQRNIPYQAFSQAFRAFVEQMLTENEEKLNQWKQKFKDMLGDNGGVITSVVPEFELVVGPYEKPPSLNPLESQNRFNHTFLQCIKVMANAEHPVVFFMDDMQWTDLASLELLKQIIIDDSVKHLFIILSYRNNETPSEHPLMVWRRELKEKDFKDINLTGLTERDVQNLLSDTLFSKNEEVANLAKVVYKKTDGNPYYINEFLKSLNVNDLIFWNESNNKWQWDEQKISETSVTENVVQFLARKLQLFPTETLKVMQYASCIGNKFNVSLLCKSLNQTAEEVSGILTYLQEENYIIPLHHDRNNPETAECRYAHDRFQQAVYSLIEESEKSKIHYQIGEILLSERKGGNAGIEVFELVGHLNQAISQITADDEIKELCLLNFEAGNRALSSNAYKDALHFFRIAEKLLPKNSMLTDYEFSYKISLSKAEAEYLNLNLAEADKNIDNLLYHARNDLEKAELLNRKLINYVVLGKHKEALEVSRKCLKLLGIHIPSSLAGKALVIIKELIKAKFLLRNTKPEELVNLPELDSYEGKLISTVLSHTVTPAYFYDLTFYVLLIFKMTNFSFKNGNTSSSPHTFVSYGVLCNAIFRSYKMGYDFGKVSLEINKKYPSSLTRGQLSTNLIGGVYHWIIPLRDTFEEFYTGYKHSVEAGDFNYAAITITTSYSVFLKSGKNLKSVYDEFQEYRNFVNSTKDTNLIMEHQMYNMMVEELCGETNQQSMTNLKWNTLM
ncbi:MAG: serine/threonine-protein kinase PknK [Bacteroidia bacterium]